MDKYGPFVSDVPIEAFNSGFSVVMFDYQRVCELVWFDMGYEIIWDMNMKRCKYAKIHQIYTFRCRYMEISDKQGIIGWMMPMMGYSAKCVDGYVPSIWSKECVGHIWSICSKRWELLCEPTIHGDW